VGSTWSRGKASNGRNSRNPRCASLTHSSGNRTAAPASGIVEEVGLGARPRYPPLCHDAGMAQRFAVKASQDQALSNEDLGPPASETAQWTRGPLLAYQGSHTPDTCTKGFPQARLQEEGTRPMGLPRRSPRVGLHGRGRATPSSLVGVGQPRHHATFQQKEPAPTALNAGRCVPHGR